MTAVAQVLVTGFPKNELARHVLTALLRQEPPLQVHCLVPTRFCETAAEWLAALPPAQRERVRTWEGDVAHLDLGLSGMEYRALAECVQRIHHCAAITYSGARLEQAEAVNVGGTYEVIELARNAPRLERLVYWSTVAATEAGIAPGVVYERDLNPPRGSQLAHTRYRAERLLARATRELPITVLRTAMLVGDSQTGELARLEGAHLLIAGLLSAPHDVPLPAPARADSPLQVVPIDYAVRAGLAVAAAADTIGRTFHIVDPAPPKLQDALEIIADQLGKPRPRGAMRWAQRVLQLPWVDRFAHAERALIDELTRNLRYDDRNAREVLTRLGVACPAFGSYVHELISSVERKRLAQRKADAPI